MLKLQGTRETPQTSSSKLAISTCTQSRLRVLIPNSSIFHIFTPTLWFPNNIPTHSLLSSNICTLYSTRNCLHSQDSSQQNKLHVFHRQHCFFILFDWIWTMTRNSCFMSNVCIIYHSIVLDMLAYAILLWKYFSWQIWC